MTTAAQATKAAEAKSKQLAEQKAKDVAVYAGYAEYDQSGFENQTSDDYTIPFLQILQGLSPQLEDNDELKVGMIINTVTGEVVAGKKGICFVPATTQHVYVEWKPRDAGGGFVGVHDVDSEIVRHCVANQKFGQYSTPEGNDLIETFYVYGIGIDDAGVPSQAVIAFSSTKIKKYKGWQTKAKTVQIDVGGGRRIVAPLFAHRYRLTTVSEKNAKGTFYNWNITFDGANAMEARLPPEDPIVKEAIGVLNLLAEGKARAAYESQTPGEGDESAQGAAPSKPKF